VDLLVKHATTVFDCARERSEEPALIDPSGVLSWAQVAERVARMANALRAFRFPEGSRLAVLGANCADTILAYAAAAWAGVGCILINYHLTASEVEYLLRDGNARAIWASPSLTGTAAAACAQVDVSVLDEVADPYWGVLLRQSDCSPPVTEHPADLDLIYTSGTTGWPKGVQVPTRMTPTVAGRLDLYERHHCVGLGPHLVVSPLYHSGPHAAVGLLLMGHKVVVIDRFDAEQTLEAIEEHRIGTTVMVPTHFVRLLSLPKERREAADVSSIKMIAHTGSLCPIPLKRAVIEWFGPVLREAYGGTESGVISAITSEEWLTHPGSVGQANPPFHPLVLDEAGAECPPGADGVLHFVDDSGEGIRYYNDPEKTAAAHVVPGTFTLGDIGHVDEDGYLYITGRVTDMVISGGVNIYPAECERILADHPSVRDVALFGIPDDEMGECLVGLISVKEESITVEQLLDFCRSRIARYKVPKQLRVVDDIPRSPMGKVDKRALRYAFLDE
jgi:long-chain acyl-CoA synthetase